jgi:exosortase
MIHPAIRVSLKSQSRHLSFVVFWILSLVAFQAPLRQLASMALRDERYSYLLVIPCISLYLVYIDKSRIFREARYCWLGGLLLCGGIAAYGLMGWQVGALPQDVRLSVTIFVIVLCWIFGFLLHYGPLSFRAALVPAGWLLLLIPIPSAGLERIVLFLQQGSADITYCLFKVAGVPVLRHDFLFSLPGVDIEIAKQCSGIRSSMTLMIAGILAGRLFLRSMGGRLCVAVLTVPIVIFKNALRIFTIAWLGIHVDRGFLRGTLHHYSGLPFSVVAVAMLVPVLLALQWIESRKARRQV